ncbi:MAG: hypothetical protein RSB82_00785 [Victivallaceae bacterium]
MEYTPTTSNATAPTAVNENTTSVDPSCLTGGQPYFDGPVKTTAELEKALIQSMGPEKGGEMYNKFINSIVTTTVETIHRDIDRARQASKKMRAVYKES